MMTQPGTSPAETRTAGGLYVEFCAVKTSVRNELTFGRDAELVIDEANRFMHRITGSFRRDENRWWLHNLAREHPMVLFGVDGLRSVLPAGTKTALTTTQGVVAFQAGPSPYELIFVLDDCGGAPGARPAVVGSSTVIFALQLSELQSAVLSEFARPGFVNVSAAMPTYAEVARRLDLRPKAIDHLLADLRSDLRASGVTGIETIEGLITYLVAAGRLRMSELGPTG